MKTLIVLFLAATAFVISSAEFSAEEEYPEVRGIDTIINNTINKVIANISDPLVLQDLDIDLSNVTGITGGLNISKVTVTGIHQIVASVIDIKFTTMALNMTILIPDFTVAIKYWADMVLEELIPLYGEGLLNLVFEGIQLIITGKANISPLGIKNVTVDFTLKGATFNLNGLINNPEFSALFSTALNDNFVDFCDTYHDVLSGYISPIIQAILDEILGAKSEEDWDNIFTFNERHYKIPLPLDFFTEE